MHFPYQQIQKTVQDTGTSSTNNTYFDNIQGGPQKVTHCQIIKKSYYNYLIKVYQLD